MHSIYSFIIDIMTCT